MQTEKPTAVLRRHLEKRPFWTPRAFRMALENAVTTYTILQTDLYLETGIECSRISKALLRHSPEGLIEIAGKIGYTLCGSHDPCDPYATFKPTQKQMEAA